IALAAPQVSHNLGDLDDVAGSQLLEVGLVPARPVGGLLGVRGAQHLEYSIEPFLVHHVANADEVDVVSRDANCEITLSYLQDEVLTFLSLDDASLDRFDERSAVMGVDNRLADLESHMFLSPFPCLG